MRFLGTVVGLVSVLALTAAGIASSCSKGKDSKSDEESTDDTTQVGEVALTTNPMGESYPDGLAVSGFQVADDASATATASSGTVQIAYDGTGLWLDDGDMSRMEAQEPGLNLLPTPQPPQCPSDGANGTPKTYNTYAEALADHTVQDTGRYPPPPSLPRQQATDAKARINGTASDCLSAEFAANVQIVQEQVKKGNLDGYGDCFLPDYGIVEGFFDSAKGGKDVCVVGYARNELRKLSAYVDFTKGLAEAMLCQALKDKVITKALGSGESAVLTTSLAKALTRPDGSGPNIKSAKLTRVAGDVPRFLTEIVVAPKLEFGGAAEATDMTIAIDHKPTDTTNAAYAGVVRISHPTLMMQNVKGVRAMSIDYSRSVDTTGSRVKYELRSGAFAAGTNAYDATGVVDFNVFGTNKTSTGQQISNDKVSNMNYASYDGYPELDVAKLSYWVNFGGTYTEAARGMVFDVKRVDGSVKGCAVAGSTGIDMANSISIRRSLKEGYALLPVGYLRPFLCDSTGPKMWLQCFVRDASGNFVPDPDLIVDVATGYDFVESAVVESKAPALADVPRPPTFSPEKFQPPPGAPIGPNMPPAGPPPVQPL